MTINSDGLLTPGKILNDFKSGKIDEMEAVYLLKTLIENSSDKSVRMQSIETLEILNIKSEDLFKLLESCLISDEDKFVRDKAANTLFRLFKTKSLATLKWALQNENSPIVINTLFEISDKINNSEFSQLKDQKKIDLSERYSVIPSELEVIMNLEIILNKHNIDLYKQDYQPHKEPYYIYEYSNYLSHITYSGHGYYSATYSVLDQRIVALHLPKLENIPESISIFSELKYLSIPHAKAFPKCIISFHKLKGLCVFEAKKLSFPTEILKLHSLSELILGYSYIHPISKTLRALLEQNIVPKYVKQGVHPDDAIILAKLDALLGHEIELTNNNLAETVFHLNGKGRVIDIILSDNRSYSFNFIPSCIFTFKFLEQLVLQKNEIGVIPHMIKRLKNLKVLNLAYNPIKCVSNSLGAVTSLEGLDLSYSKFIKFPEAITKLTKLKFLCLGDYQIFEPLTQEIITELKNLENFDIVPNEIDRVGHKIPTNTICDVIDLKILEYLENNSRDSCNSLALRIGKTEATIRRRIKKLQEKGIIKKFTILYEINSQPITCATVKLEPNFTDIKRILKELVEIPEITDIWRLSGNCGLLLKVEIPSIEQFNPLIENKISQIDGIKIVETCFITDIIK